MHHSSYLWELDFPTAELSSVRGQEARTCGVPGNLCEGKTPSLWWLGCSVVGNKTLSMGIKERTDVLGSSCAGREEPEGGTQEAAGKW